MWNPGNDQYLSKTFSVNTLREGKKASKKVLCNQFQLNPDRPLIAFIGRLVSQKGADLLPNLFASFINKKANASFIVLGTGTPELHAKFRKMSDAFVGFFDASLNYNEKLAHQIYAGSDFMIIPSRFEPCGLNQLYAMRYGSIPIVRAVGGLKDTVIDISEEDGYGITFQKFSLKAAHRAVERALNLYDNKKKYHDLRRKVMNLDFSWDVSARKYVTMYRQLMR